MRLLMHEKAVLLELGRASTEGRGALPVNRICQNLHIDVGRITSALGKLTTEKMAFTRGDLWTLNKAGLAAYMELTAHPFECECGETFRDERSRAGHYPYCEKHMAALGGHSLTTIDCPDGPRTMEARAVPPEYMQYPVIDNGAQAEAHTTFSGMMDPLPSFGKKDTLESVAEEVMGPWIEEAYRVKLQTRIRRMRQAEERLRKRAENAIVAASKVNRARGQIERELRSFNKICKEVRGDA